MDRMGMGPPKGLTAASLPTPKEHQRRVRTGESAVCGASMRSNATSCAQTVLLLLLLLLLLLKAKGADTV